MRNKIKFLILSDLHAAEANDTNLDDSRLLFREGVSEYGEGFLSYVKSLDSHIDALICPGDISNKANIEGFHLGWSFLNQIKNELSIASILSVPGNHDHQSRETAGVFDPKHNLQFVKPLFPFDSNEKNTHFWGWHWCYSTLENVNVISLNTSAYHGYADECQHGRIATEISDQISEYINSDQFTEKAFNLLICHHHPEKMDYVDSDYDCQAMEGGSYLIRKLDESDKGPWLIIHGHKHFADIGYARTSHSCGATIFSAGSFSAMLYPSLKTRTSNQFYILEIDIQESKSRNRVTGTFKSYEWTAAEGWHPSKAHYLPAEGGFGNSINPRDLARDIGALIGENNPFLNSDDLRNFEKQLKYFTPSDFKNLLNKLQENGFEAIVENGKLIQIGIAHVE